MDHCVNLLLVEKLCYSRIVAAVDLVERDVIPSCDLLYAVEACQVAVRHVVCNDNVITRCNEFYSHMTAYIAGTAGNKYCLCHSSLNKISHKDMDNSLTLYGKCVIFVKQSL